MGVRASGKVLESPMQVSWDGSKNWQPSHSLPRADIPVEGDEGYTRLGEKLPSDSTVRWFTDRERRYAQQLWQMSSVYLKSTEVSGAYGHGKVWRRGLEVAIKIKGSQGNRCIEWHKPGHP